MMKNWIFYVLCLSFLFACQGETKQKEAQKKEATTKKESAMNAAQKAQQQALEQAKTDEKLILDYLDKKGIDAERTNSGLYYQIIKPGDPNKKPSKSSQVSVQYVGKLLDGTTFDRSPSGENITFPLNRVISGWQEGIPKIGEKGEIKLFIPSHLAYGKAKVGGIPKNSVLLFDVTLLEVK